MAGSNSTALSGWLATAFPNLYGAGAGSNDLAGQPNFEVAAFFKTQFSLPGSNVEAQVLATALNVYATTLSLGGTTGQAYGFTVSVDGLGADSFNVGADGAAFGVAKKDHAERVRAAEGGQPAGSVWLALQRRPDPSEDRPTTFSTP